MKRFRHFRKFAVLICMALATIITASAQVTIGSDATPDHRAILDLKGSNKAFLPPRVALDSIKGATPVGNTAGDHTAGLVVYNTTTNQSKGLIPGLYYNDGSRWVRLNAPQWFYMPSIPLPVTVKAGSYTINLWEEYKKQFDHTMTGNHIIASSGAPDNPQPAVYQVGELYYYVTGYDDKAFKNVALTGANGHILSYEINGTSIVSDSTFMNIVLVVK
jgi:hypothetical protein